ncbi:MAG: PEGA domain-containing protein, partial [Archangium sp.]|nr:PEGA domain-containing protein [Archangium sp.]
LLPVPAERVEDSGSDFVVQLRPQPATPAPASAAQSATAESPIVPLVPPEPPRRSGALAGLGVAAVIAVVGIAAWFVTKPPGVEAKDDAGTVAIIAPPTAASAPEDSGGLAIVPELHDAGIAESAPPDAGAVVASMSSKKSNKTKPKNAKTSEPVTAARTEDAKPGVLNLDTDPWSKVYVDGRFLGSTPLSTEIGSGPHDLVLVNAERALRKRHHFTLAAGETLKLKLTLDQLGGAP